MAPRIFQQCLGHVNTLTVEECSEAKSFEHLTSAHIRSQ